MWHNLPAIRTCVQSEDEEADSTERWVICKHDGAQSDPWEVRIPKEATMKEGEACLEHKNSEGALTEA